MSLLEDNTALLLESLDRTLAEMEALAAIYGDDHQEEEDTATRFSVLNIANLESAKTIVETQDVTANDIPELHVEIICPINFDPQHDTGTTNKSTLSLRCCLAAGYPEAKPAVVTSIHKPSTTSNSDWMLHPSKSDALKAELTQTAESLVGTESVMTLVETMKELAPQYCSSTANTQKQQQQESSIDESTHEESTRQLQIIVITTHHLLDHAPDNWLAKGHKYKLDGYYRFGTPGLAIICTGDKESTAMSHNVEQFQAALEAKMPQKKFDSVVLSLSRPPPSSTITGWVDATNNLEPIRDLLSPDEFADILQLQGKGR